MKKNVMFFQRISAIALSAVLSGSIALSSYATDVTDIAANEETTVVPDVIEEASDAPEVAEEALQEETTVPVVEEVTEEATEDSVTEEATEPAAEEVTEVTEEATEPATEEVDSPIDYNGSLLMIDPDPDNTSSMEGSAEGNGSIKITTIKRPKNVISMVVPILEATSYDFVIDPDGLLSLDPNNTIIGEGSTVYFRSNEADNTYSLYADFVNAVNKSTVPIELSIELNVTSTLEAPLAFTSLSEIYTAETPSICFAIVPTEPGTVIGDEPVENTIPVKSEMAMIDSNGFASKKITLPCTLDNFELVTSPTEDPSFYVQEYKVVDEPEWSTIGFTLYGACSANANWSDVAKSLQKGQKLSLTLTYKMTPIVEDTEDEGDDIDFVDDIDMLNVTDDTEDS
ncbi:MAG: hypothetical protein K5669_06310 [Lachnospiraceae bacterium]|nr:hypothetical protein [Lachnospiraceae bacterium]